MKKRVLAVVIVVIMLIALVPTAAPAHSGDKNGHNHKNTAQHLRVRIDAGANGKINSPGGQTTPWVGNTWTFSAVANSGYKFDHWEYSGNEMPGAFSESGANLSVHISQAGHYIPGHFEGWNWVRGRWDYRNYRAQAVFVPDDTVYDVTLDLGAGGTFDSNSASTIVVSGKKGDSFSVPAFSENTGYDHVGWNGALNFNTSKQFMQSTNT